MTPHTPYGICLLSINFNKLTSLRYIGLRYESSQQRIHTNEGVLLPEHSWEI